VGTELKRISLACLFCLTAVARPIIWQDPGDISQWDFAGDLGAAVRPPQPPFTFVSEDLSGTQPKIFVRDSAGTSWNVKFGYEVKGESFCWRVVRACGYFAEPSFFIVEGQVQGLRPLQRGGDWIHSDGHFTNARFQYRDANWKFLSGQSWRWNDPRFAGSSELSGLKLLIMLFSNWDNKDSRVGAHGSNTAIFQRGTERFYAFTDWGSGMGRWGSTTGQTDWRCEDFTAQTGGFVKGVKEGRVVFGYEGNINQGFENNIPPTHVAWLLQYLGRITDAQLLAGLKASGGTDAEADCFVRALRSRIDQLRSLAK
jgi:hypothetical protein